jgi:hypothetical protein
MKHSDFPIPRPSSFPFALALVACAALGCGRSADLFPDDAQSNDGCVGARGCEPDPDPALDPDSNAGECTGRACGGSIDPDSDGEPASGEPDPTLTDPESAQPSGELPLEPAGPDLGATPAGPQMPEPGERPPEAPDEPPPELPRLDAGSGVDAGVEPPPADAGGPRPGRPPRPPRP